MTEMHKKRSTWRARTETGTVRKIFAGCRLQIAVLSLEEMSTYLEGPAAVRNRVSSNINQQNFRAQDILRRIRAARGGGGGGRSGGRGSRGRREADEGSWGGETLH